MTQHGYKQFCPVAMAAEVLCTRWTVVLLRELVAGSTRFNDLRRGVPKMSPTLLSQRLKELEVAGIVERKELKSEKGIFEYRLTEVGQRPARRGRGGGLLGPEVGRGSQITQESGSVAAHVGHAAQSEPNAAARPAAR